MPTYEYRCGNCGHELEAVQSFSDPALTVCPQCGEAALRKLFGNVGVVFKGSGFYRNDSRNEGKGKKTAASETKPGDSAAKADTSTSSDTKSTAGGSASGSAAAKPATDSSAKSSGGSTAPAASKSTS